MRSSLYVTLMSGAASVGALGLLDGYAQGFAFLAANDSGLGQVAVKDTTTAANNKKNVAAHELITQSGTSPKLVKQPDGTLAWSPHNLLQAPSANVSGSGWTPANTTVSGTQEIVETADTGVHYLQGRLTTISGSKYTITVEFKKGDGASAPDWMQINPDSGNLGGAAHWANYNITTVATGSKGASAVSSIEDIGDGWVRAHLTVTANGSSGSSAFFIEFTNNADSARAPSYAGSTAANVFVRNVRVHRGTATDMVYVATPSTAAVFYPAFEWGSAPGTGVARWRMLVEPAATNLFRQNSQFGDVATDTGELAWGKTDGTVSANATTAPNGQLEADTITANAGTGLTPGRITQTSVTTATNTVYTASIYIKRGTYDFIQININNQGNDYANYNLSTGVVGTTGGAGTASIETCGDFYRLIYTYTAGAGTDRFPFWYMAPSASATYGQTWNPTGTETYHAWGAQLETGTVATSPIPTYGSTVTRAAGAPNFALSSVPWSATAGTLYWKGTTPKAAAAAVLISIDDGTANERVRIEYTGTNVRCVITDGGSAVATLDLGAVAVDTDVQVTFAWEADSVAASLNGGAVVTDTDTGGGLPTVTTFRIDYSPAGERGVTKHDKIVYVPERVANANLPTWRYVA